MLILLSPAKKLDFDTVPPALPYSAPDFAAQSEELAELMRTRSTDELRNLQHISPALAQLNRERWRQWSLPEQLSEDCHPALYAFRGDVYLGLQAERLSDASLQWAQRHLRILSGLHGLLRPLDVIRPYRLEMGTELANSEGRDLYAMWRERITARLSGELALDEGGGNTDDQSRWVLNLASAEYAKAVDFDALQVPVVSPVFQHKTRAGWRMVSFSGKRARGTMAAWAIERQLADMGQVADFAEDGYCYEPSLSEPLRPVFRREKA